MSHCTWARVCSSSTAWPQAALISSQSTGQAGVRPRRKPEMVAKGPSCQMWNASLYTLVWRRRSRCDEVRSICRQRRAERLREPACSRQLWSSLPLPVLCKGGLA